MLIHQILPHLIMHPAITTMNEKLKKSPLKRRTVSLYTSVLSAEISPHVSLFHLMNIIFINVWARYAMPRLVIQ